MSISFLPILDSYVVLAQGSYVGRNLFTAHYPMIDSLQLALNILFFLQDSQVQQQPGGWEVSGPDSRNRVILQGN